MLSPEQRQEILKAVNEKISINHFIAGVQPPDPVDVVLSSDEHAPQLATPQQSITVSAFSSGLDATGQSVCMSCL